MLFSVHYRHMTGAVYILKAHPTFLEKMKNIHTHARTHIHKEAPGDHQRGCYQIWTECNRGFSKEFFSGLVQSQSGGTLLWLEKHWSHAWRVWFRYISIGCHHSKGWWNLFSFFFAPPPHMDPLCAFWIHRAQESERFTVPSVMDGWNRVKTSTWCFDSSTDYFSFGEQYRFWFLSKVKSWYATRLFGWMMAYSSSSKCIWRKCGVGRVCVLAKCSTSHFSSWTFQIVFWLKQPLSTL